MALSEPVLLNLAAFHPGTHALGPGLRAVVWVQGCPFTCPGCIAPEWIPFIPAIQVDPIDLAEEILNIKDLGGITISGGEPMMQAEPLSRMLAAVFARKPLNVIVFTGFKLGKLRQNPPNEGVTGFLDFVDVLIDGQYTEKLNDGHGLRGSTNQRFNHLTDRLKDYDFEGNPRNVELYLQGNQSFLIGIPTHEFFSSYNLALQKVNKLEEPDERT